MINIYKITNNINGKIYIGRTKHDIEKRFRQHITNSKRNSSVFNYFMNAIRKYGEENFSISLIECCEPSMMYDRETYNIMASQSFKSNIGYNTNWVSSGSNGDIKLDTKTKLSESSKKYWESIPKEDRFSMLSKRMSGLKKSKKHKYNISKSKIGIKKEIHQSNYKGVSPCTKNGYRCTFYYGDGDALTIGNSTTTEIDCATIWDIISYKIYGDNNKLNFPENISYYNSVNLFDILKSKFSRLPFSKYKHITFHKKSKRYIVWSDTNKFLKKCKTEEDAMKFACNYFNCLEIDLIRLSLPIDRFLLWYKNLKSNITV